MKKISNFLEINNLTIILVIFPYLALNWKNVYYSKYFNFSNSLTLLCCLLLIYLLNKYLIGKEWFNNFFRDSIYSIIILIFYGYYFIIILQSNLNLNIRGRIMLPAIFLILVIIIKIHYKKIRFLNHFFLIFSIVSIITTSMFNFEKEQNNEHISKNKIINLDNYKNNNFFKPVILIILDEYSSPKNIYNTTLDYSVLSFSEKLKKNNNWIVNDNFHSYETSTFHSLTSMFNYNLSINEKYKHLSTQYLINNILDNSDLYDSLKLGNTKIINWGILPFGKERALNSFFLYPQNFWESLFFHTSIYQIITNTGFFSKKGFNFDYFPTEDYNKYIINNIEKKIIETSDENVFIYIHLLMPHFPFAYRPNILEKENNLKNYISYYKITNIILYDILKKITSKNKYRIILSGDHGYRSDKRINPNKTFIAYFGFDTASINQIKSVQDLGYLIHSNYRIKTLNN